MLSFFVDKNIFFFYDKRVQSMGLKGSKRNYTMKILSKQKEINPMSQLPKLNRIIGQIEGVKRMLETKRTRADVLTQLRSVRGAVKAVESNLLNMYLKEYVCRSFDNEKEREKALKEVCELFSRFEN